MNQISGEHAEKIYQDMRSCDGFLRHLQEFAETKQLLRDARHRWTGKAEQVIRDELFEPLWRLLGFKSKVNKRADQDNWEPDYILKGKDGKPRTVAFVYRWDRGLDGPDLNDPDTPEENPGAAVVSALAGEHAQWAIVTNGKLWRIYSREAHSRSTNFYEVDLEAALVASDETDPNEAFRYWWLFFRSQAFLVNALRGGLVPPTPSN